jgi:hypothetical protein
MINAVKFCEEEEQEFNNGVTVLQQRTASSGLPGTVQE